MTEKVYKQIKKELSLIYKRIGINPPENNSRIFDFIMESIAEYYDTKGKVIKEIQPIDVKRAFTRFLESWEIPAEEVPRYCPECEADLEIDDSDCRQEFINVTAYCPECEWNDSYTIWR